MQSRVSFALLLSVCPSQLISGASPMRLGGLFAPGLSQTAAVDPIAQDRCLGPSAKRLRPRFSKKTKHWSGQPQLQNTTHYCATGLNLCRRVVLNASETIYGLISTLFVFLVKRTTHKKPNPAPTLLKFRGFTFSQVCWGAKRVTRCTLNCEGETTVSRLRLNHSSPGTAKQSNAV